MGPFVPDLISDQLNLVVALILGLAFGFVLEQAGFSSSRRLAGVFYGYDFTVLRVFFTAAVTAMSGVLLLGYFGLLDTDAIYVNPTWLLPAIVGGAIMGVGFILGGYCPGTSVCAAAIGKIDGMFFVGGGLIGVFAFGELFPLYSNFFGSTSMGPVKVFDSLGISQGLFALILIVVAVGAFTVTTLIERRVDKKSAPSLQFKPVNHFAAGIVVIALGILFLSLPDRKVHLVDKVSAPAYVAGHSVNEMEVDELAFRIVDLEPNIRVIDVRSPGEYTKISLPGSNNIQLNDLFSKDWAASFSQRHVKKVIVGENDSQERTAYFLLGELGYENLAVLKGGFDAFDKIILNPSGFVPTGTRWDADVIHFRQNARAEILKMIESNKNKAPKEIKKRKIQGGC
ncbi:MAG TPA: YeeE/YedE thiosulfate transporter family protein [Candidatus Kryptonia bacterium]